MHRQAAALATVSVLRRAGWVVQRAQAAHHRRQARMALPRTASSAARAVVVVAQPSLRLLLVRPVATAARAVVVVGAAGSA
jgi:hypothetical protein